MNIRSLPKNYGELVRLFAVLETRFDVIILTAIGTRIITTVQCTMGDYQFYHTIPASNMYSGAAIYIRKDISYVCIMDELKIEKTGHCPWCEMEIRYLKFTYDEKKLIVGGIYHHPSGNIKHVLSDLETALDKIPQGIPVILVGDINIDIVKYDHAEYLQYMTISLSNQFLPYITLPSRIAEYPTTCIDHIFIILQQICFKILKLPLIICGNMLVLS